MMCQIRRLAGLLQISVVLQGGPSGRMRPTLLSGEELVGGGINKPEIFQTELNTPQVELGKRLTYVLISQNKTNNYELFA